MRKFMTFQVSALVPVVILYTFMSFGNVLLDSTHVYLVEQAVCRKHYMLFEPARISIDGLVDEELCKIPEIETKVASIYGLYNTLWYLPTLFLAGPYGKIGVLLGKKMVLLMNMTSTLVAGIFITTICYFYQHFDIRWIYVAPFFDIFGGGSVILWSFLYTYVSELAGSKRISRILYKLSAVRMLFTFLGYTVSSFTLRRNVWLQRIMGHASLVVLICVALLLPNSGDTQMSDVQVIDPEGETFIKGFEDDPEPDITETTSLLSSDSMPEFTDVRPAIVPTIFRVLTTHHTHTLALLKGIFSAPPFIRTSLATYFIITIGAGMRVIFTQWSSLTYNWLFAEVACLTSFEMIMSSIVLLSLPGLSSFLTRTSFFASHSAVDLFIAKFSIAASTVGLLLMGFAPSRVSYVAAIAVFTLGYGVTDALRSFITGQVDKEEVEKLYLGLGMMETLGGMIATFGWSRVLAEVLGKPYWLERIPFMTAAGILVGAGGFLYFLGRFSRRSIQRTESVV